MNKKILCLLLMFGFLVTSVGNVCAESAVNPASDYTEMRIYTCIVTNGSGLLFSAGANSAVGGDDEQGSVAGWAIPTTSIRPDSSKIIGWSFQTTTMKESAFVGAQASLHDLATAHGTNHRTAEAAMTNTTLFTEAEVTTDDPMFQIWFPYPKKIVTQLGVMIQVDQSAVLNIYYIR